MSLPREPRQKMINMMYLVLTALLALNVSSEILNAFKVVNNSLEISVKTVNLSTTNIMASLQEKTTREETMENAKIWYPKAQQAESETKKIYDYLASLKTQIIKEAGGDFEKGDSTYKDDNLDIATRIMVEHGAGKTLRKMLEDYRNNILQIDPKIAKEFATSLPIDLTTPKTQNRGNQGWDAAYFRMVPTVAAVTMLSKFQNDVKTAENKVVTFCHEQVGKVELIFDQFKPIIGQNSTYLMPGQELEIRAGVGAFSKALVPEISIGGRKIPIDENGVALWKNAVGSIGSNSIPIHIEYFDQQARKQVIDTKVEYTVGQSNTSVALDKMNVLFIGVDNPVSIAGSGGAEQISASITQGSLTKVGQGKYTARVTTDGECRVNVTINGKAAGSFPFRVRSIPDPTPMVGQRKSGDPLTAAEFKSQAGVRAILENFFYETQFNVTSYRLTGEGEGFDDLMEANNSGAAWGPDAQRIVTRSRRGTIITIDEIRCLGPDGRTRRLPSIVYTLK